MSLPCRFCLSSPRFRPWRRQLLFGSTWKIPGATALCRWKSICPPQGKPPGFISPELSTMNLPQTLAARVRASLEGRDTPFVVALCGWADTGKSTVAAQLVAGLARLGIAADAISTDDFMRNRAERDAIGISGYDLRSIDMAALQMAIVSFLERKPFCVHPYDNRTGTKSAEPTTVSPVDVLVVEGIHSLHPRLVPHSGLKVFIDADEAIAYQLRVRANQRKRGMSASDAVSRVPREWKDYSTWVRPRCEHADLVVQVDLEFGYRWVRNGTSEGKAGQETA
ncbi:hypothetical protein CLD22_21565 [Rubrivivax gelatinosus]|nr:hypothetical protein [Rubrivivax gelatinosus]